MGSPKGDIGSFIEKLELESIKQSLANLRTFPCVKTLEERGQLSLHGAFFGVMDGRLRAYDPQADAFVRVGDEAHSAALASPRF